MTHRKLICKASPQTTEGGGGVREAEQARAQALPLHWQYTPWQGEWEWHEPGTRHEWTGKGVEVHAGLFL